MKNIIQVINIKKYQINIMGNQPPAQPQNQLQEFWFHLREIARIIWNNRFITTLVGAIIVVILATAYKLEFFGILRHWNAAAEKMRDQMAQEEILYKNCYNGVMDFYMNTTLNLPEFQGYENQRDQLVDNIRKYAVLFLFEGHSGSGKSGLAKSIYSVRKKEGLSTIYLSIKDGSLISDLLLDQTHCEKFGLFKKVIADFANQNKRVLIILDDIHYVFKAKGPNAELNKGFIVGLRELKADEIASLLYISSASSIATELREMTGYGGAHLEILKILPPSDEAIRTYLCEILKFTGEDAKMFTDSFGLDFVRIKHYLKFRSSTTTTRIKENITGNLFYLCFFII